MKYLKNHPHQEALLRLHGLHIEKIWRETVLTLITLLQAAANLFNVESIVISSLGRTITAFISPMDSLPICRFHQLAILQKLMVSATSGCKTIPLGRTFIAKRQQQNHTYYQCPRKNTAQKPSCSLSNIININTDTATEPTAKQLSNELSVSDQDSKSQLPFPPCSHPS